MATKKNRTTITEAMQEIETLKKRLADKLPPIVRYVCRDEREKDPLQVQGGSEKFIAEERQSHEDLCRRLISLRLAVAKANDATMVKVGNRTMTISEWLVWKREVYPQERALLDGLNGAINAARATARKQGVTVVPANAAEGDSHKGNLLVMVDELEVVRGLEELEQTRGTLDGQLSLKNATVFVDIE